jgi:Major intrinsic protein
MESPAVQATYGNSFYGLAIGFTVFAQAVAVGNISGGAFNPAVAIAVRFLGLANGLHLWMYWLSEFLGAAVLASNLPILTALIGILVSLGSLGVSFWNMYSERAKAKEGADLEGALVFTNTLQNFTGHYVGTPKVISHEEWSNIKSALAPYQQRGDMQNTPPPRYFPR